MFLEKIKILFKYFNLSSLNVVFATVVCSIAFFKLPEGSEFTDYKSIAQLAMACWAIYILDRLLDNIKDEVPETERHIFHKNNQYTLQIVFVSLVLVSLIILFFQPRQIIYFGLIVSGFVVFYFLVVSRRWPLSKEWFMPAIYTAAVVGVPFTLSSSLNLSSWLLGFMLFLVVIQNSLSFSYFEYAENPKSQNICKKMSSNTVRKIINYTVSINLFIAIYFFGSELYYPNKLSFVLAAISLVTSLLVIFEKKFRTNYRWIIDGLLFLPLIIF
ncbi:hypothetical protein EGI22_18225 [Lacihabitans sp. LS3-19]|uniref:hypothetical protein n=1 Tax=Lacihabitans sp. LS3-19 TaxID=2487335 RepID=UPI0020CF7E15|nr:hypothetical protein [Lacihabitans sp. LS3-19]MCP9769846.1 hypothetical protein [Lacihabitans sp. LS3-19]